MSYIDIDLTMRWADMDAYQHLNNVAVMRILEEARIQAFWPADPEQIAAGAKTYPSAFLGKTAEAGNATGIQTFVAAHQVEYVSPLTYRRDGLTVRLWLSKIGVASINVDYLLFSRQEVLAAQTEKRSPNPSVKARTVVVAINPETGRPARIGHAQRENLKQWQDEALTFRSF